CMQYHPASDRWYWLYDEEAKKIRFEQSYNKIPKDQQPIPLGYFRFLDEQTMILEVRSFQRMLEGVKFFNNRLNWRAAEPVRLRLVNKFFGSPPNETPKPPTSFAEFFDHDDITIHSPEVLEQELIEVESHYDDPEEKQAAVTAYMEEKSKQKLPEIEEIAVSIHDEGISILEMALRMKHIEAWEHWQGNEGFTQHDLIQSMLASIPEEDTLKTETE
ncbi:MAG: hypothetical protein AAGF26_08410, partial [Cyanobacteria bacterium P01_G01_bin.49]